MKLTELFEDSSVDILSSEVKDLLYFLKNKGVSEIETDLLVSKIKDGDKESIIDLLNTMPDIVQTANTEIVQIDQSSAVASAAAYFERGGSIWLLDGVQYPTNLGFGIRTIEVSGADAVVLNIPRTHQDRRTIRRSSMRADRFIPVVYSDTSSIKQRRMVSELLQLKILELLSLGIQTLQEIYCLLILMTMLVLAPHLEDLLLMLLSSLQLHLFYHQKF